MSKYTCCKQSFLTGFNICMLCFPFKCQGRKYDQWHIHTWQQNIAYHFWPSQEVSIVHEFHLLIAILLDAMRGTVILIYVYLTEYLFIQQCRIMIMYAHIYIYTHVYGLLLWVTLSLDYVFSVLLLQKEKRKPSIVSMCYNSYTVSPLYTEYLIGWKYVPLILLCKMCCCGLGRGQCWRNRRFPSGWHYTKFSLAHSDIWSGTHCCLTWQKTEVWPGTHCGLTWHTLMFDLVHTAVWPGTLWCLTWHTLRFDLAKNWGLTWHTLRLDLAKNWGLTWHTLRLDLAKNWGLTWHTLWFDLAHTEVWPGTHWGLTWHTLRFDLAHTVVWPGTHCGLTWHTLRFDLAHTEAWPGTHWGLIWYTLRFDLARTEVWPGTHWCLTWHITRFYQTYINASFRLSAFVRMLASVRFSFSSVAFFLPTLNWRSVGRSNFDRGLHTLIMLIHNDIRRFIWNCHIKNWVNSGIYKLIYIFYIFFICMYI